MANSSLQHRPSLLVFADDWGRHPSSCQHLVRRLGDEFSIVWANTIGTRRVRADSFTLRRGWEKIGNWRKGVQKVGDQMWVVDLPMLPSCGGRLSRVINEHLVGSRLSGLFHRLGLEEPTVLTTLPHSIRLIRKFPRRATVYYCTDDYSFWPESDRGAMQEAEQQLGQEADLILPVSDALMARLTTLGPCKQLPHGVDFAHFASTQSAIPAEPLRDIPGPRIGFFGLIYEKIDFELLTQLSREFPQASLVMIGPIASCPESFRALPNVHLVGPQPYQELPRWLSGLDVLLMPYVDDEMIRQSSPLKLRECLASGKPTVSVDVPEARKLEPHVRIARDGCEFVQHVRAALGEDPARIPPRQASVSGDDWDRRAEDLSRLLKTLTPGRG